MDRGSPGSYVTAGVPEDDYERTDETSSLVVEYDEVEDLHELLEQAPSVPRIISQLRTSEQSSPPAVTKSLSNNPGNRSEKQQAHPRRFSSLGGSVSPKMMPDDEPIGGSRDLLSPGSMGSSALNDKLGDKGRNDAEKPFRAWEERNKEKNHHVNTGTRSNSNCIWDIMKKPSGLHPSSNRGSTTSTHSTSSSSSAISQDSAISMTEESSSAISQDSSISMIEESKPKKPTPPVQPAQPAQPAVSKPGPPKLPYKVPVISAEQYKPEPEKGVFIKPALRSTPKPERKSSESEQSEKPVFDVSLKKAAKPDLQQRLESPKHRFETPILKSTGLKITTADEHDNDNTNTSDIPNNDHVFDKPVLRQTKTRNDSAGDSPTSGVTFEKPPLKSAVSPGNTREKPDNSSGRMFEKPALKRATSSPEKELKPATEPKGTFDRPVLWKIGSVSQAEKDRQKQEKPSWLQPAAEKQSNVLDVLQSKVTKPVEKAVVRYSYVGEHEDELSLTEGDIINVLDKDLEDSGWWRGELNGRVGAFPDNIVELIKEEPSDKASRPRVTPAPQPKPKKPPPPVQPAQPAVSKPGPPKLPYKGPVISAEQYKPEPEKEEKPAPVKPAVPSKKPIFPPSPLTKKPTKSIDIRDIENKDDGKHDKEVVKGNTELRAISLAQTTPVDLGNKENNSDTKTRLRELYFTHGRTSKHLQEFCKIMCSRFLQIREIIDAYPAYKVGNETNIVFVLTVNSNIMDIHQHLVDFDVETIIKTVSLEMHEDDVAITDDFKENDKDIEILKECISNNAEDLMQQHKYLNIIRGGSNKPINGSKREPCLVLYVHAKGLIPIDEEPFKKSYNGINVEVREGRFTPYMNHADVLLKKVRMGCKIEGHQTGTLGVFIEHPSYGICGITCAHVAISATEMENCKSESGRLLWEKIHPSKKCIHQPSRINGELNQFGQIVEVIYKEGKSSETGIEIALIQIEKRHPDSGKFPTPRSLSNSGGSVYTFESGKTCGPTRFNTNNRCFKVGSVTDFTEGTIEMRAPNVVRTDKHTWDYDHLRITLYNQIFVRPRRGAFADFGDSGSPVFVKDEETGEPVCIGLVEGGLTAGGLVVVTPITKILEELGISQLKAFPKNVMQELEQMKLTLHALQIQFEELLKHLTNRT